MADVLLGTVVRHIRHAARQVADPTDDQLLRAFAADHDPSAFAQILRRHGPMVLGVCRRVLQHTHDAEDAFQATFLVLAQSAGAVRNGEALGGWLHGVSYRLAMKAKRAAARRRKHEGQARAGVTAGVDATGRAGGEIAWREVQAILDEEVERLPVIYRAAFVLCCLHGLSQAEAARQLDVKEGTVSSRLNHARQRLREALARRGITLSAVLSALAVSGAARAAVPRALADTTAAAAARFARGAIGGISAKALSLAEGAIRTMLTSRMTLAGTLVLTLGLLGAGAAMLCQRPAEAGESLPAAREPAAKRDSAGSGPGRADQPKPAAETTCAVAGRVLGPDGQPVRGAKVYVSTYTWKDRTDPTVRATTDANGRFRLPARKKEVDRNEAVVAVAEGFGPAWFELGKVKLDAEQVLRLVKDEPITGRVLDLEGRPVAGVAVRVVSVRKVAGEDLTGLLADLQRRPRDRQAVTDAWRKHRGSMSQVWGVLGAPKSVTTGANGRFRLAGFGRERVVGIEFEGPAIAHARLDALTRPGLKGLPPRIHESALVHVVAPTKPIRGTVKDRRTGKPVAGIAVGGQPQLENEIGDGVSTKTDARGHFKLVGLPKVKSYHLNAGGSGYVVTSKEVADTPGLGPIEVHFEVERALSLRVRVIDKVTGRPVRAYVQYAIRRDNPSLNRYPTFRRNVVGWSVNDKDGWDTQTVLPGPAVIAVQAIDGEFTRARLKDQDEDFVDSVLFPLLLDFYHAIVPVDLDEKMPKSLVVTIALDPGRSVRGSVVGPDSKPLDGVLVAGLTAVKKVGELRTTQKLTGSTFTAFGLEPRRPRVLVFLHREKKLAAAVTVRGDERDPVVVGLERLGSFTGRLVNGDGKPIGGVEVFARPSPQGARLPGELVVGGLGSLRNILAVPDGKTDAAGRFRVTALVPGLKYNLGKTEKGGGRIGWLKRGLTVEAGKEVDLGALKSKPAVPPK
jgi:RNA polymerase sigma factor (sigma-70 family)